MLVICWSAKGGSGTTVVAAALGILLARTHEPGALLVDLAGDLPAVLGLAEPAGPGVGEWLRAPAQVPEVLARLEVDAGHGLALLPLGPGGLPGHAGGAAALIAALGGARPVVVDAGTRPGPLGSAVADAATRSLLVVRPCYLALRAAIGQARRPSGVVVVDEPGRALTAGDLEAVLGVPLHARLPFDPAVARAVDAGLLASRLPRSLDRGLRRAALTAPQGAA